MFRAEQMVSMGGTVALAGDEGPRRVVNTTDLELRDAVLVDVNGPGDRRETYLGTIAPGASVEVERPRPLPSTRRPTQGTLDPSRFLRAFAAFARTTAPRDQGEIRLVAWSPRPFGGQKLEPSVDRHRGLTLVVVHLRFGPPPRPTVLGIMRSPRDRRWTRRRTGGRSRKAIPRAQGPSWRT